jgi:hypothetical protein
MAAEGLKPLSPVVLQADWQTNGDLWLNWTRRSRCGFAWIDEVDAPLGEAREEYRVKIVSSAATIEWPVEAPALMVAAADIASLGSGPATIKVRQVGDWAASHDAQASITLP